MVGCPGQAGWCREIHYASLSLRVEFGYENGYYEYDKGRDAHLLTTPYLTISVPVSPEKLTIRK